MSRIGQIRNRRTRTRSLMTLLALPLASAMALSACSLDSAAEEGEAAAADSEAPLFDQLPQEIQDAGEIKVGSSIDYPPFEYYEGKELAGFEVELAEELEKQLGVKLQWNNASFDTLLPSLKSNRYDIIYGATNDTAEREQTYDFVYYLQSSQGFVTAKGNADKIQKVEDICGQAIAAVRGGIQAQYLDAQSAQCVKDGHQKINVLTFDGNSEEQVAVKEGRALAMLENYPTAATFAEDSKGALELSPLQVEKRYFGMVVNKDDTELRDTLVKAWQGIIDDGSYGEVLDKWGLSDIGIEKAGVNAVESGLGEGEK
jgi:polar amino acid transport system substrate-binding protein